MEVFRHRPVVLHVDRGAAVVPLAKKAEVDCEVFSLPHIDGLQLHTVQQLDSLCLLQREALRHPGRGQARVQIIVLQGAGQAVVALILRLYDLAAAVLLLGPLLRPAGDGIHHPLDLVLGQVAADIA